jgi:hypothetical protein
LPDAFAARQAAPIGAAPRAAGCSPIAPSAPFRIGWHCERRTVARTYMRLRTIAVAQQAAAPGSYAARAVEIPTGSNRLSKRHPAFTSPEPLTSAHNAAPPTASNPRRRTHGVHPRAASPRRGAGAFTAFGTTRNEAQPAAARENTCARIRARRTGDRRAGAGRSRRTRCCARGPRRKPA